MPSNKVLLSDLEYGMAMKSLNLENIGAHILEPTVRNRYVREMLRDVSIFSRARIEEMTSQKHKVHGIGMGGRVLQKLEEEVAPDYKAPVWKEIDLIAEEFGTGVQIGDKAIRRSIEKQNTVTTVLEMCGAQVGRDWEALAVFGDKTKYGSASLLNSQDGWLKKTETKLKSGTDFNKEDIIGADGKITKLLKLMVQAYNKEYLGNRSRLSFELPPSIYDQYLDEAGERQTVMGDEAWVTYTAKPYRQISVNEAPVLEDAEGTLSTDGVGIPIMLNHADNLVYGVFHEITMESKREADLRRTKFITTMETDQGVINPDVGVVAFIKD